MSNGTPGMSRQVKMEPPDTDMEDVKSSDAPLPKLSPFKSPPLPDVKDASLASRASDLSRNPPSGTQSPAIKSDKEEVIGGDITLKVEPGKAPKLARSTSQRVVAKPPQLFSHLPDATPEATSVFEVISDCQYANKYMGYTEPALDCDCTEQWDPSTRSNHACGEDSDCINRATKMECSHDCTCGAECQNQRFQRKQYANVTVFKTEKKGFGLRAESDLGANDFIFEYIGEVIGEPAFRRRMIQYDEQGIKHFYFMSLTKGEFVDATKRGNLGRFCNHSCNPNCYVDKWVVGDKLRMGIFAERKIQAGEELTFNYNVDRYGADPQPCYCGEPNCMGFIGGKTQSDSATKLSYATIEALGLDDVEGWENATAKKPRKKKTEEDDEEYLSNVVPKGLDEKGVSKVMATLATCKEKWIAVKLLNRIQLADEERVRLKVIQFHGYRILNTTLKTFVEDDNVVLQVLAILNSFPRLTRNKIQDSGIETTVGKLVDSADERVKTQSTTLLEEWSKLEVAFRIKKIQRDPNAAVADRRLDRRDAPRERSRSRSRSRSKSVDAPRGPVGPRRDGPPRGSGYHGGARPPYRPRPPQGSLPNGWFEAVAQNGSVYYYNSAGTTTWQRPTAPAVAAPPPPPPKVISDKQILDDLISSIVSKKETQPAPKQAAPSSTPSEAPKKERKEEKWKSYSEDKRKKLYENTLFPHISHVMNKYKKHLERDELKRFGKEIAKKLVASDFKHNRVQDPTKKLDSKQERQVKNYVKEYFDKAVKKKQERAKRKAEEAKKENGAVVEESPKVKPSASPKETAEDDMQLSENEVEDDEEDSKPSATPADLQSPGPLKRPRDEHDTNGTIDDDGTIKRIRTEDVPPTPPAPPPPPPPPPEMPLGEDASLEQDIGPEDVPEPVHNEGHEAVTNGTADAMDLDHPTNSRAVTESRDLGNRVAHVSLNGTIAGPGGKHSPMQIATPPTTGSPDIGEEERDRIRKANGGL